MSNRGRGQQAPGCVERIRKETDVETEGSVLFARGYENGKPQQAAHWWNGCKQGFLVKPQRKRTKISPKPYRHVY